MKEENQPNQNDLMKIISYLIINLDCVASLRSLNNMNPVDGMIFGLKFFMPFCKTGFRAEHITENNVRWALISRSK